MKLGWLEEEALKSEERRLHDKADFAFQTPMMNIINHHVKMVKLVQDSRRSIFSKETVLEGRDAVHRLRILSDIPKLPKSVTNVALRELKGNKD